MNETPKYFPHAKALVERELGQIADNLYRCKLQVSAVGTDRSLDGYIQRLEQQKAKLEEELRGLKELR